MTKISGWKLSDKFLTGEYVITNMTGEKISVKFPPRRTMFQIGYDEKELKVRAELFRRVGHEVISVADNEAAKNALNSIHNVDAMIGSK